MRTFRLYSLVALALGLTALVTCDRASAQQTLLIFDDFNTGEGHFAASPGFSGSSVNFQKTAAETVDPDPIAPNPSTAVHDTSTSADTFGTGGSQRIDLFDDLDQATLVPNGGLMRLRHLSALGSAVVTTTNTRFETGAGDDGWIGVAVKTLDPGWKVQMYIEFSPNTVPTVQSEHHGSVLKDVTADGEWHFYQWNLDDFSGSADGWTSVANIIGNAGSATIEDGFHTIDSVIFRHADVGTLPIVDNVRKTTLFMDYVVKSSTGTITLPEPPVSGGVGADFNGDATLGPPEVDVDGKDFLIWQAGYGETLQTNNSKGDANADGVVDDLDFRDPAQISDKNWTSQFGGQPIPASLAAAGAIPEPAGAALALVALAALAKACRPRT